MSKKIVFKISKEGDVLVDKVEGYGPNCVEATKSLEQALGKIDGERKYTEEYDDPIDTDNSEHIQH